MPHAWTYETAHSFWSRTKQNPEAIWEEFASAERFLLEHRPRSAGEAAQVIAILVEQGGDRRTDGRDVEALARIRRFLTQLAKLDEASAPPAMRAA